MHRMAYLTQFSILALLNPIINKMADEAILLLICSHEVWVKETYDWSTYAYACVYRDPVFTSQSYDTIICTSTRRTNLSVFLVLMLMLTKPSSLGYRCASACAYALVKTRLKACQTTSSDGKRYRGLCRSNRLYLITV